MSNDHRSEPDADPPDHEFSDWASARELFGVGARLFFLVCVGVVIVASLIGAPHVVYSNHVAHFAVLYVLTLATMAAFPDWEVLKAFWRLVGFATAVGLMRVAMRHYLEAGFLNWIADVSGIIGGLAPIVVQRLREGPLSRSGL